MKILITGLALSRNLGAPAMALTLMKELSKFYPEAEYVLAVSATDMKQELKWLNYYKQLGFKIEKLVPRTTISAYILNKFFIKKIYQVLTGKYKLPQYKNQKSRSFWLDVHEQYLQEIKESEIIISMFGISYVGDGVHKSADGLSDYSAYYYAKKFQIPYARFIQSYGPFDDWKIRYFAKKELNKLPFVYARGKNTAAECRTIVTEKKKVLDVPDIAILLPIADNEWLAKCLKQYSLDKKNYIVLSPSAVIYMMNNKVGGSIGDEHVRSFSLVAKYLISKGEKVLFLPHMYSDKKFECDREICYKVVETLNEQEKQLVNVIEDDIDPMQAKSLIANSKLSIVSRYHALVAAVSTSTPVITIGWNIKYYDLMEYYCIEDMAIDTRENTPEEILELVQDKEQFYLDEMNMLIYSNRNTNARKKVKKAIFNLKKWIDNEYRRY